MVLQAHVILNFELCCRDMAFILRRCLSTSARLYSLQGTHKFVVTIPAPVNNVAALETPELQQLARKSQGSWKELSNDEVVQRKSALSLCTSYFCLLFAVLAAGLFI